MLLSDQNFAEKFVKYLIAVSYGDKGILAQALSTEVFLQKIGTNPSILIKNFLRINTLSEEYKTDYLGNDNGPSIELFFTQLSQIKELFTVDKIQEFLAQENMNSSEQEISDLIEATNPIFETLEKIRDGNYQLISPAEIVWDEDQSKKSIRLEDGDRYHGEVIMNSSNIYQKHGTGTLRYADGGVYEGDFVNNKIEGKGTFTDADGDVYEGDFVNDKIEGKGTFTDADGDVYEGDFVDYTREGKGICRYADGGVYEGDFVNDQPNGKGTFRFENGSVYRGDFVNGRKEGKGTFRDTDGDIYEGNFVNDQPNGKGTLRYTDGDVYEGDFVNGKKEGKGTLRDADGSVYVGDFVDNEISQNTLSNTGEDNSLKLEYGDNNKSEDLSKNPQSNPSNSSASQVAKTNDNIRA